MTRSDPPYGHTKMAPPPAARLVLRNDILEVVVLPDKGADIYAITDRATGVDVLFKSPWGWRDPQLLPACADTELNWLARYPGGWQLLVPNAGPARVIDGVERGYHGEAAIVGWQVVERTEQTATLTVDLITAPLRLHRTLTLAGDALYLQDRVRNTAPDPVQVTLVQHPVFGAPFIDENAKLSSGAGTVISDAHAPGNILAADTVSQFPHAVDHVGQDIDLRVIQPAGTCRSMFAALTDFDEPWFAITNSRLGFGVGMAWNGSVLPHAWLWQESHASLGFPWFRRANAFAIEPANVLPGDGTIGSHRRGLAPVLEGDSELIADLTLVRYPSCIDPRQVNLAGTVETTRPRHTR